MVIVTLWWWVSICVMVDRSGGLVWCGGGDGLLVVVNYNCCRVVRRERKRKRETERQRETHRGREREREAMRNPPLTQPVAIFAYEFYPQHKLQ